MVLYEKSSTVPQKSCSSSLRPQAFFLFLVLSFFLHSPAAAAEDPSASATQQEPATAFDRFFGDSTFAEEFMGTQLRVNLIGLVSNDASFTPDANVNIKLQMSRLDKRLHLLLSGDSADDPLESGLEGTVGERDPLHREDDAEDSLALQYLHTASRLWNFHISPGVRFDFPPEPFVKTRLRRSFPLDRWELKAAQGLFWYLRRGVGSTTRFTADRPMEEKRLLRATTGVAWSEQVDHLNLDASLLLYQSLTDGAALEYQLAVHGTDSPSVRSTSYHASASYRRNLGPSWLYGELKGALLFPREEDFDVTPSVMFKLEGIFGGRSKG